MWIDFHIAESGPYIDDITQSAGGSLPVDTESTLDVQLEDFDLDGDLDIQILAGFGSGGSWYNYYRWNGKRYEAWKEPSKLGLNSFDLKKRIAIAGGRSGPSWSVTYYRIERGRFRKFRSKTFDEAQSQRSRIDSKIPDDEYALITEEFDRGKLKSRKVRHGPMMSFEDFEQD